MENSAAFVTKSVLAKVAIYESLRGVVFYLVYDVAIEDT